MAPRARQHLGLVSAGLLIAALALGASPASAQDGRARIDGLMRNAVEQHGLRAAIVQVKVGGRTVITRAYGESAPGTAATTRMRFRAGTVATGHMSTLLLRLAQQGKVRLGDKLSKWLPDVRGAKRVTLRMLAGMTAGYRDYAIDPRLTDRRYARPFAPITTRAQLRLALGAPLQFAPGTNLSYSHSDYVLLGRALEEITGQRLDVALRRNVLRPLGLRHTRASQSAAIARPLHAYSAERRAFLGIPRGTVFLEDSTFWNPAWVLARGAVQTTDIRDLTRTAIGIGSGKLLSRRSHRAQIAARRGLGHPRPGCDRCTRLTRAYGYGLGVERNGPWVVQRSLFSGYGVVASYLPSRRVSIALAVTFRAGGHDVQGNLRRYWSTLPRRIGRIVAPRAPRLTSGAALARASLFADR